MIWNIIMLNFTNICLCSTIVIILIIDNKDRIDSFFVYLGDAKMKLTFVETRKQKSR